MNDDLTKKLDDLVGFIINDASLNGIETDRYPWVNNIKQAFMDEGWINTQPDHYLLSSLQQSTPTGKLTLAYLEEQMDALNKDSSIDWAKRHGYMTGQEWYDRFVSEILSEFAYEYPNHLDGYSIDTFLDAAKKASGIE